MTVWIHRGNFEIPGFRTAAAQSGMRYKDRLDCALVVSEAPASAAGVFTQNRFCAAPVLLCKDHLEKSGGKARAILVNAGIANACTGDEGLARAGRAVEFVANALKIPPEMVLAASTGVIGPQIDLSVLEEAIPRMAGGLRPDAWDLAAQAIMTTDTVPKTAWARGKISGRDIIVGGIAKGAGMIAPDMATMLAFVATDAALAPSALQRCLKEAVDCSFNRITVDGDTSTNDTVLLLAGGAAGNPEITDIGTREGRLFADLLRSVCQELARQIVRDAEGATKFVTVRVLNARTREEALQVARTVADSPLVKTALFGEDANWGRIVAAAGRSGVPFDPQRVSLRFNDVCVFQNGGPVEDPGVEEKAGAAFREKNIEIRLDLGSGSAEETVWTCDLSYDYVKINADYRT